MHDRVGRGSRVSPHGGDLVGADDGVEPVGATSSRSPLRTVCCARSGSTFAAGPTARSRTLRRGGGTASGPGERAGRDPEPVGHGEMIGSGRGPVGVTTGGLP